MCSNEDPVQPKKRPEAFLSFQNQGRPRPGCSVQPLLLALRVSTPHSRPLRTGNGQGRSAWWVCNAYVCLSCLACCVYGPLSMGLNLQSHPTFLLHHQWRHFGVLSGAVIWALGSREGTAPSGQKRTPAVPEKGLASLWVQNRGSRARWIWCPSPRLPAHAWGSPQPLRFSSLPHPSPIHCAPSFRAQFHCKTNPARPTEAR